MTRQKLALVVTGPPSVSLSRMKGFSPVRIRRFESADMVRSSLFVGRYGVTPYPASRQLANAPRLTTPGPRGGVPENGGDDNACGLWGGISMLQDTNGCLPTLRFVVATVVLVTLGTILGSARAADEIDELAQRSHIPPALRQPHGYSDFTDPLGRFLDFLAAGAFADAKSLKPQACAEWLANRQTSALTGKVQIWDTEIDLNKLCAGH
jgi:hypothetical protein